jgi:hypothetical protein
LTLVSFMRVWLSGAFGASTRVELAPPWTPQLLYFYFYPLARQEGVEPPTDGLEGRCSIQLSYWRSPFAPQRESGREDSNLRPPAPKAGALPGCATPR